LKVEAAGEKRADDGQKGESGHRGRDDGCGLAADPPEIIDRQLHPDDDHREDHQGRHAGIHDSLQQVTSPGREGG
jgi:hypothetical protein